MQDERIDPLPHDIVGMMPDERLKILKLCALQRAATPYRRIDYIYNTPARITSSDRLSRPWYLPWPVDHSCSLE